MINRPLMFDIIYKRDNAFVREAVRELFFEPRAGVQNVKTVTEQEITPSDDPLNTSLLQFTGEFDKAGAPIYHAHLLEDADNKIYEVVYFNGGFSLLSNDVPIEMNNAICMTLTIIGDSVQDADLLLPEKPQEVMQAAIDRPLPPLVTLKKPV